MARRDVSLPFRDEKQQNRLQEFGALLEDHMGKQGISQRQLARLAGLNPSTIRDYLRGECAPRRGTLDRLITALRLKGPAQLEFLRRAGYVIDLAEQLADQSPITGSEEPDRSTDSLIAEITSDMEQIRDVSGEGNPSRAVMMAGLKAERLRRAIKDIEMQASSLRPRGSLLESREPLWRLLAEVLSVQGWARSATSRPGEIWTDQTRFAKGPLRFDVNELLYIADRCGDKRYEALGYTLLGDGHYCAREYGSARDYFERAVSNLGKIEKIEDQLALLLTFAKTLAYLGERNEFEKIEGKLRELVVHCSDLRIKCGTLEAIARARRLLGLPDDAKRLDEANEVFATMQEKGWKAPIVYIQLIASELDMRKPWQRGDEALRTRAEEGRSLADDHGIPRYVNHFEMVIKRLGKIYYVVFSDDTAITSTTT